LQKKKKLCEQYDLSEDSADLTKAVKRSEQHPEKT
jgi:hypothetical protein